MLLDCMIAIMQYINLPCLWTYTHLILTLTLQSWLDVLLFKIDTNMGVYSIIVPFFLKTKKYQVCSQFLNIRWLTEEELNND